MTPCIEHEGRRDRDGYGRIDRKGRGYQAHRWAWEQEHGPIPPGMNVLHRCDNPPCVNVEHLFLGTQSDNMLDCYVKGRHSSANKTHCLYGHSLKDNVYMRKNGSPECKTCRLARPRRKALR